MKKYLIISSVLLLFIGCEGGDNTLDIPLKDMSGKIVIEGNVTDDAGPYYVRVTKSQKISEESGQYPIVNNAVVVINDDQGQTETLKYEDGKYKTINFVTSYGRIYTLSVTVDGITYKANSKLQTPVSFDGLEQTTIFDGNVSRIGIKPIFTDPGSQQNYYLFKTTKSGGLPVFTPLSDNNANGQANQNPIATETFFKKDDTVYVEMNTIDEPVYKYFKALPQANLDNSGSTVTPVNPPSNFSNGALGYFSAQSAERNIIIIH